MNPFIHLLVLYGLMTLGSASILYFSFKGKVDASGKLFLLAESLMLVVIAHLITTNLFPGIGGSLFLYIGNLLHISSEFAILLSIYGLTRKVKTTHYWWVIFITVFYSALIELGRFLDPKLPLILASSLSGALAITTYIVCKNSPNKELNSNLFLNWISIVEIGLFLFSLLRLISYFSDTPIRPRQPSSEVILLFTLLIVLNLFRYISYQSLRISWFNPATESDNPLNQNLKQLAKEKNQLLQGLISSNRALGVSALANSLAHQLSQPITGVIFRTETIKRDLIEKGGLEKSVETLNEISMQLDKLSNLVNNLRKLFSSKDNQFKEFSIQGACEEALEIIKPSLTSKNITLIKKYEESPVAFGNQVQIQQLVINLFNNAIEAIENDSVNERQIILVISKDSEFGLITIKDSGPGIPENVKPHIFELYKSSKLNGLGIGLWLSKTIIENHQGNIKASNNSDVGACLEIQLPLAVTKNKLN